MCQIVVHYLIIFIIFDLQQSILNYLQLKEQFNLHILLFLEKVLAIASIGNTS